MSEKITEIFGVDVFSDATMVERLPKKTYAALKKTIENGDDLDPNVAEVVANAMKDWAIEKGATHYTHWFQPMTGITAEKHDSFISPTTDGKAIMEFSGKELIKGEPDASSFPSGGLRATFEARGYTAWDCTSPAFLRKDAAGVTLCIPTAFCSYTGEALDVKTPLLRSMEALSNQAVRILKLFGHQDVKRVSSSAGPEQEYFLVDKAKYLKRDDLIFSGRTLFGAMPPKGQELDDHYFGSIKERVASFMKELNNELWKMGVTAKTQHNEVAPAQHELAPIYATANIATDHNQLVMEYLKKVASRHGLACLLHEKPFAGVNGSGKHNNWSMSTDTGKNLLDPGKTPHENIQFLLFLSAVLKAVDLHADLLRVSAANPGNDHRLGANEAPPAIISVFVGAQLEDVLAQLIETGEAKSCKDGGRLNVGVHTIPALKKDATDRNRTSPFAFTGNKFEFRMVASSASIGAANTVLNTIVADVLCEMADELEKASDFDLAVHDLIKKTVTEHQRIVFNGNGYAEAWVAEAERRGLPNIKSMVEAIPALISEKSVKLFGKHNVFSATELHSRAEIMYESYSKAINIEAKTMISMASVKFIPAVIKYTKKLADSINSIKSAVSDADVSVQSELLKETSALLAKTQVALKKLQGAVAQANAIADGAEMAIAFRDIVVPAMADLRAPIDELEVIVDKELWPVPTYGDLLFEI
ncbi:glutamine synthetase III [Mobilitalea sibirica]|uniref:Glutamine synthetase III n=1 Tax=Mobilitalea sibirica TaxID=1462919 RepID=A0A8J7KW77_9FIRM|nr:glutamine synthetase III [Mobilitalea sibirica]MBH1940062.1 glutamine synthetase III [Mobilitalea sibirica]